MQLKSFQLVPFLSVGWELNEKSSSSHTRENEKVFNSILFSTLSFHFLFRCERRSCAPALFTLFNPNLKCFFFHSLFCCILLAIDHMPSCIQVESSWQKKKNETLYNRQVCSKRCVYFAFEVAELNKI